MLISTVLCRSRKCVMESWFVQRMREKWEEYSMSKHPIVLLGLQNVFTVHFNTALSANRCTQWLSGWTRSSYWATFITLFLLLRSIDRLPAHYYIHICGILSSSHPLCSFKDTDTALINISFSTLSWVSEDPIRQCQYISNVLLTFEGQPTWQNYHKLHKMWQYSYEFFCIFPCNLYPCWQVHLFLPREMNKSSWTSKSVLSRQDCCRETCLENPKTTTTIQALSSREVYLSEGWGTTCAYWIFEWLLQAPQLSLRAVSQAWNSTTKLRGKAFSLL